MKNRRVLNIAGILIIAGMLAGCAKTPESSLRCARKARQA